MKHCRAVAVDLALRACLVPGQQAGMKLQRGFCYPHRLQPGGTGRQRNILAWIQSVRRGFSRVGRATSHLATTPALCLSRDVSHRQYQGLLPTLQDPCPGWHWWHSMAHAQQELQIWLN